MSQESECREGEMMEEKVKEGESERQESTAKRGDTRKREEKRTKATPGSSLFPSQKMRMSLCFFHLFFTLKRLSVCLCVSVCSFVCVSSDSCQRELLSSLDTSSIIFVVVSAYFSGYGWL